MTGGDGSVRNGLEFSPDSRMLASGHLDGTARLWDMRTHKQIGAPIAGHAGKSVTSVRFSPDGRMLASGGSDETVRLWDVRTHRQLGRTMITDPISVTSVRFSPDGNTLASAGFPADSIRLWDVRSRAQLAEVPDRDASFYDTVAFHPNGRDLALARRGRRDRAARGRVLGQRGDAACEGLRLRRRRSDTGGMAAVCARDPLPRDVLRQGAGTP